jgi:hypothetical protein
MDFRQDQAHAARMYDYYLGGTTNVPADREAALRVMEHVPFIATVARGNRRFLRRAVRYLAAEQGIRQFLDIGSGIPTSPNIHEVAQQADPEARVVYVDHDPLVLAHARELLAGADGHTSCVDADLRDVEGILSSPGLRETIDLDRPVALMLIAVLHFLSDADDPRSLVRRLMSTLPSGSWLVLTHVTGDFSPAEWDRAAAIYAAGGMHLAIRDRAAILPFFDDLEVPEPGVDLISHWWPEPPGSPFGDLTPAENGGYGAIGRKG